MNRRENEKRIAGKSGLEQDIYSGWRHIIKWNHCAVGRLKRFFRRRNRRKEKQARGQEDW